MNKKAVGAIAVAAIVVAYGGGTWFAGKKAQSLYDTAIDELQAQAGIVRVVDRTYQRNFFGAVSTVTLEIGCAPDPTASGVAAEKLPRITFRDTIHHGPFAGGTLAAATVDTELVLDPKQQAEAAKLFGAAKPLTAHTKVSFNGGYATDIAVAPVKYVGEGNDEFAWQGVQAHFESNAARSRIAYEVTMPGLEASVGSKGFQVKMGKLSAKADLQTPAGFYLATGPTTGRLESLAFTAIKGSGAEAGAFKTIPDSLLQEVDLKSDGSIQEGLYSSKATLTGKGKMGQTPIDRFVLSASFNRLHAATYQKIMEAWNKSNSVASCAKVGKPAMAELQALGDQLSPDLKTLFKYGPVVGIDQLTVEIGGKRGKLSYSASMVGVTDEDLKFPATMLLMKRGVFKANGRLPAQWLEQLAEAGVKTGKTPPPEMVGALVDQGVDKGFVKREGEDVTSQVEFSNGALKVNGKPMNSLGT